MIPVISANEMKMCDKYTIENKINEIDLIMEAAKALYKHVNWTGNILMLVGSGNNGADCLALSKLLLDNNIIPSIYFVKDKISKSSEYYLNIIKDKVNIINELTDLDKYNIIVDGIIGNGFSGELKSPLKELVEKVNNAKSYIVSVDINTGLDSNTGKTNLAIKSDITISLGYFKYGHFLNDSKDYIKSLVNENIGINLVVNPAYLILEEDVKGLIKHRLNNSNKGTYGYVGIMGGSENYPGAVKLANLGHHALTCGCGVVRIIVPDVIKDLLYKNTLEETIYPLPSENGFFKFDEEKLKDSLKGLKALSIGPGLGMGSDNVKILEYILDNLNIPLVIDADAINTLSKMDLYILNLTKCKVILTPHLKELSRLTNLSIDYISKNLVEIAKELTKKLKVVLLIKGPTTIVAKDGNIYLVSKGTPGMATAGSGDVLTGIITGLLGYIDDPLKVTYLASYINGLAGEYASLEYGDVSMLSSDTARMVTKVIKDLTI